MGKMFFNILATLAEFEIDLLRLRTREGTAIARSKGKLRGKQPKLTARQQAHLAQLHDAGEHTIAELANCSRSPGPPSTEHSSATGSAEMSATDTATHPSTSSPVCRSFAAGGTFLTNASR